MTERIRGADWRLALLALCAWLVAALAEPAIGHISLRSLLTPTILIVLVTAARQSWGSVAVAATPFLLPDLRTYLGVAGRLQLTLLTAILVMVYWDTTGRPTVSRSALGGAAVFGVATLLLTWAHGFNLQVGLWVSLVAPAGIVFGSCLAASKRARAALGIGCVPLALLALAEIAGFHNPWPNLVHAETFVKITQELGAHRAQSTFGHPLIAGGCLAGMSALMLHSRTRFSTLIAAILAGGALATVSRSAILGLGAALACGIAVSRQRGRQLVQAAVIVVFAWIIATQIPDLRESITNRVINVTFTTTAQPVRNYARTKLVDDLTHDTGSLLLGGGVGASGQQLTAIGGIDGFDIFDNQYVTSVYDLGLLPMILVAILITRAITVASPDARRLGLPAMTAVAAVMFFADGGYWLSLGFLAWITVGLSSAPAADA